jgi:integrase
MIWTITEESARKFKFPEHEWKSDKIKFDDKFPGFGLRIRTDEKTGKEHRSYIFQYKLGSQHRRMNCGKVGKVTAAEARKTAERHAAALVNHKDPAQDRDTVRKKAAHTLGTVIEEYLAAKQTALRPGSRIEVSRQLQKAWKPLHDLPIDGISRAQVAAEISAIAKRSGPSAANHARACLSAFFAWCIGEGLCEQNPVVGTNKQQANGPRERILIKIEKEEPHTIDWSELMAIWRALPESDYGTIVKLLALTGCRRDEIGGLRWSEIDFNKRTLNIPGIRTKNHEDNDVPLSPLALSILQAVREKRGDRDFLFGRGQRGYNAWADAKKVLDNKTGIKENWTVHDIRRTVRTGLGALGVSPHVAEAVLNHLPAKLVRTYDTNRYLKEKRAALDLWASELDVAIRRANGENVTTLRRG